MKHDIFNAIADPTRRAIIMLIAAQPMTPGAIAEHFDSSRQAVSKHIKMLTDCQLLKQERQGREILYHFNQDKIDEVEVWLKKLKENWETRFSQLDEVLRNNFKNDNDEK
ncbi:metalloregulator ArsR/SmtB family transcription factor [Flavobacterium sp. Sd200]|uniref:ArsR/SmtB family transcription factor n=1 Tax=Flavobacterium sp. Sd200 TaxID=2692211 RepID=UPI00136FF515|nr:metalloregulator ArsR/SmtB family transcription factor [Flavobacterium sp. Sd200]MXN92250.1 metalloregulator ArsR/SmtB family transcription factor [Flavobacterium sp. Sd200]